MRTACADLCACPCDPCGPCTPAACPAARCSGASPPGPAAHVSLPGQRQVKQRLSAWLACLLPASSAAFAGQGRLSAGTAGTAGNAHVIEQVDALRHPDAHGHWPKVQLVHALLRDPLEVGAAGPQGQQSGRTCMGANGARPPGGGAEDRGRQAAKSKAGQTP
jgi:hypothetical protein